MSSSRNDLDERIIFRRRRKIIVDKSNLSSSVGKMIMSGNMGNDFEDEDLAYNKGNSGHTVKKRSHRLVV